MMKRLIAMLLASLLTLSPSVGSEDLPETQKADRPAQSQGPADVFIVVGAAGEDAFGQAFANSAARWREVAEAAGANIVSIEPEPSPADADVSDRQRLREAIAGLEPEAAAPLWIVLMGHGTFSQNVAKFNLRGPDVSAAELAEWLQPISRPLVLINASSSSSPFINALSGDNRVIVTATRSGSEQNYSRFGEHLSQAIGEQSADIDHDGEVSILEAFLAASAAVRDFYRSSGRIATEHALLDDNGDGLGTPATAFRGTRVVATTSDPEQSLDGMLAAGITLAPAATRLPFTKQEQMQRAEIEAQLADLRARRDAMTSEDYQAAVLPHLIRLARIYEAAEARAEVSSQ